MSINVGVSFWTTTATLTAESTSNVYGWSYQIDGGSWHTIYSASNTSKKSVKTNITGLSANTQYTIRVRARTTPASSTASYSYQSTTFTTLRRQILNSVDDISVDNPVPTITFKVTFNDNDVSNWDLVLFFSDNFTFTMPFTGNKSGTYTIKDDSYGTLESEFAFIMNEYMSNKTTKTFKFDILPRGASSSSSVAANRVDGTFYTSAQYSAPYFDPENINDWIYWEASENVNELFNRTAISNVKDMIQGVSRVGAKIANVIAKNGASIVSTKIVVGNAVGVGEWNPEADFWHSTLITDNAVGESGKLIITAIVYDSRGYSVTSTIVEDETEPTGYRKSEVNVIPYIPIAFDEYRVKRINDIETTISAIISGSWSSIKIGETEYNSLQMFNYRYVQTPSGTPSDYYDITPTSSSVGSFEYEGNLKGDNDTDISLNVDNTYAITIVIHDKLTYADITIPIPKGTPLMSFREGAVGVLTNNPTFPLDVNGLIGQNGKNILGWQRQLGSTDNLDDITETGIYTVAANTASTNLNYPVGRQGYLQVMKFQDSIIFQIYYVRTGSSTLTPAVYIRTYYSSFGAFSNWFSFTLT